MDIKYLFKTFELTNAEFYKNEENRWKFFQIFGAALSGMIVAAYKIKGLELPLLILSSLVSLGGIFVLISVYRIIVSVDKIGTRLQREVIKYLFRDTPEKIEGLLYPESTQFLRGSGYIFSMHNATTLILIGFFVFSTCRLAYLYLSQNLYIIGGIPIVETVILFTVTFKYSTKDYYKTPIEDESMGHNEANSADAKKSRC